MFPPLWLAIGVGALAVAAMVFWAEIQNWLADLIFRTRTRLGPAADTVLSALVILDRVIVGGQRVVSATIHSLFSSPGNPVEVEEQRMIKLEDLPADVRERLEAKQPLRYELSVSAMQVQPIKPEITYKLPVRRVE